MKTSREFCSGTKFYRFQPCRDDDGSLRGSKIAPDSLWFSTPQKLNDPMDIDHPLDDWMRDSDGNSPVLREMAKVMYAPGQSQYPREWINDDLLAKIQWWASHGGDSLDICDAFRERLLQLGVACFTPSWNNPPMWAHYAKDWEGFAIEYCIHEMNMACAPDSNDAYWQFWVNYCSRIGQTSLAELLLSPYEAVSRILSTKTFPWSYEQEWRLIHLDGGNQSVSLPVGMQMTGIVLGPKSSPEQDQLFADKCAEWGLPLRRVRIGLDRTLHLCDVQPVPA